MPNFAVGRFGFDMKTSLPASSHRSTHMTPVHQLAGIQLHIDQGHAPVHAQQADQVKPYARSMQPQFKPKADGALMSPERSALLISQNFSFVGRYSFQHNAPGRVNRLSDGRIIVTDREDRYVEISPQGQIVETEVLQGDLAQFLSNARNAQ